MLHQNAKVLAVLSAIGSFIFLMPMSLFMLASLPSQARPTLSMLFIMPVMYLIGVYVMTLIGCAIYNFMVRDMGGIEFETVPKDV